MREIGVPQGLDHLFDRRIDDVQQYVRGLTPGVDDAGRPQDLGVVRDRGWSEPQEFREFLAVVGAADQERHDPQPGFVSESTEGLGKSLGRVRSRLHHLVFAQEIRQLDKYSII